MQKTMKKTLAIILAILMIVTTVPFAFAADVVASGTCGANGGNVKWTLDSDGTLTISGTGDMQTFATLAKRPWYDYTHDIKKIIIEDGVTSISDYTAYGCFFATSISIGKDVKSIGPSNTTFYCRDLETITVSEDNEYYKAIDNVLFSKDGKELLKVACKAFSGTYNVPDGVVKINEKAFDICKNIEKVVLPDSVEEIGEYAFYQCKSLKILDIGMARISSVGNGVFEWIEHPVEVIVDKDNEYVSVVNGSLFSKIDGTLFYAYVTDNKCVVPYGVKIIPESTIYVEDGSVVVPDTVETIERNGIDAFDSVVHYLGTESQLQEIYEGDMSDFDFEWLNMSMHYCVQQSNIPASCTDDGVTEWYCSTCDETIKYVTGYAFGHDIVEVDAKAPTCTEIGWDAYEYCTACDFTTKVEIPVDPDAHDYTNHYCKRCGKAEDGYYAAGACGANGDNLNWSLDSDGVLTISGEGEMQEMFIYLDQPWKDYRRDIKEVVIEEGVTKIAEAAFYLLTNLEKVTISSTAEFEDFSYCFIGCSSLKEFIVSPANPYYCTDEYGVVFSKDKSKLIKAFDLSDVDYVIPDTVTSVAEEAFAWIKIKSIIVNIASESMFSDAEIGKLIVDCANVEAFAFAMTRIEEIVLTNKVSFIGYSAFGGAVITSAHYLGDPANLTIEANENESLTDVLHYCEHKEGLAPTCTEIGWDAYEYCTACTYTTYVEKEALNHKDTLVKVNAKAPTCTEIGWDAYEYCTACDYSTYVELPAITHTDANCDYKCDYNCGYVYETLDFSDAKAITEENGKLYIDGAEAEIDGGYYLLNEGKYKLAENIFKTKYIWVGGEVNLDLNGYVWDLEDSNIVVNAPFSVYDTSADKNGKITSSFFCTIDTNNEYGVFSLYSGTIENNSVYEDRMAISALWASVNLYGGKVTGNGYALSTSSDYIIDKTVVLGDVVLESGEGYAPIQLCLRNYSDVKKLSMDVTDYTGESLEIEVEAESTGKFDILKGVSSADEAEKYKLNIVTNYNNFHEKTEYDEATGDVNIYIAKNAFTQQPSAENCFTVDFNNPAATFQWYEVEEEIIGTYVAESFSNLFTYNFKAGDILKVSTDSDVDLAHLAIGNEYLTLTQTQKSKTIKFNADKTITVSTKMLDIEGIELEFSIIREKALDGETGKALKNPECKKSYCCKATVNGRVYNSDTVVGHEIIQVEEKAATCTETGWEAYGYCTECDYTTYKEIPASHEILQVGAKAATCTETGWEAYEYCTACTYTTYVELPENGHTPLEAVKENEVAPKCDVTGSYDLVVYCDDCGAELDRDTKTVDALKHSFTKYEVTEEAKCGVAGKEVAACDNGCGATDEKAIEALKHDIVIDEAVAPKCGETGLTQGEHCTRCDYKVEQEIVPALEHKDADGDYKCDNGCGHEFEKPAPEDPAPDTPDEPTDSTCDHLCHKSGFMGFLWKIVQFFSKLFKINPTCECGAAHY